MNSDSQLREGTSAFQGTRRARGLASLLIIPLLSSCSGPSTYNDSANPPVAVAHAIGAATTSAAGADPVTITVRSQSQVTLTGDASSGGAASIGSFVWSQTDAAPVPQVTLLYLASDTVTFTAPKVSTDTTLHFTLTVTTAGNTPATAHVTALVKAVNDPNQFLALLPTTGAPTTTVQHHFKVAVDTLEGLPAPLAADAPVCVSVARTINYVTRSRTPGTVTLPALTADTSWAASVGGAANDFTSYTNPKVTFEIPALNQDDINVLYSNPGATANLGSQIVPADIDKAQLSLTASASPGPCAATSKTSLLAGKTLQVLVQDEYGTPVGSPGASPTFTPDQLVSQQAGKPYETAETARAYYAAIDPAGTKTTLNAWLTANCFNPAVSGYGADAHATYTNNYDLGFGRDMYFTTCKAGSSHPGDMASVVINYVSLEAAASQLNPVIAVAMEYGAAPGAPAGSRRFPKFYIFAPDDRDGNFYRISTANFDHRGEKYVPGACIMCHGGSVPKPPTANFVHASPLDYPSVANPTITAATQPTLQIGDVDAAFMPWDLDSFLYTAAPSTANVDTSYVGLSVPASGYTRTVMEPALKKLNQLSYCTYQAETENIGTTAAPVLVDRMAALRALVGRWYGAADKTYPVDPGCATGGAPTGSLLPNATYDDVDSTPAGWSPPQTAAQQQPGVTPTLTSDMLYHQVYARHCRSCHTANAVIADQFTDYPTFMAQFQSTQQKVKPPASPGNGLQYAFMQGRMPLARLTMDRFWVDFSGGDSAAKLLATHIEQVNGETDLIAPATCDLTNAAACDAVAPGAPIPDLYVTGPATAPLLPPQPNMLAITAGAAAPAPLNRFSGVFGDAGKSFFIQNYSWSLCLTPATGGACEPQDLIGAQSADPGFSNSTPGTYQLTLAADNGSGAAPATFNYLFKVPQKDPSLAACPADPTVALGNGQSVPRDYACIASGDEPHANAPNVFEILVPGADPALPASWTTSVSTAAWTASTTSSSTFDGTQYDFGYALNFMFSGAATTDATLQYRVRDVDGGTVGTTPPGMITFHLTDTLTAGNFSQTFAPQPSYTISGAQLGNNIVPANAIPTVTMVVDSTDFVPVGGSLAGSAVPASGSFVFTPATAGTSPNTYVALDCDYLGNKISQPLPIVTPVACTPDTFQFHLLAADAATQPSNEGLVTIQIDARTSFSREGSPKSVFAQLGVSTNCVQCHGDSANTAAQAAWIYNGADFDATYQSLISLVTKGNGAGSTLYMAPCVTHESPMDFDMNSTVCQAILNWINEGAYED